LSGCILAAVCVAVCQAPPADDAERWRAIGAAREQLLAMLEDGRSDALAKLQLVAALVLSGDYRRAEPIAEDLLAAGSIAPREATEAGGGVLAEVFAALVARPADAARALGLLERSFGPDRPDALDIAWPFARAFALARAGESARAASALEMLAERLRQGAGLQLRTIRFVQRVASFGVYDDDPRESFCPGDSVLIYAEPTGFTAAAAGGVEGADARWRVNLRVAVRLVDRVTGAEVGTWGPDSVEHRTRSPIHDLHLTRLIVLPVGLADGPFEVRLEVEDVDVPGSRATALRRFAVER
jgi:hypothetical protein